MKRVTIPRAPNGQIQALGPGDEGFPEFYGPNSYVRIVRVQVSEDDKTWALLVPTSARALEDPAIGEHLTRYAESQPAPI